MNKYEEAKKWLDEIWKHDDWAITEIRWCAVEQSRKLVEKETPKKPHFEGDGYANGELVYDTWVCPNCEKHYEVDYDEYDYCPNCGQHIDWSEYGNN